MLDAPGVATKDRAGISAYPYPECMHPVHLMSSEYFSARNCADDPGNKDGKIGFPLRRNEGLI